MPALKSSEDRKFARTFRDPTLNPDAGPIGITLSDNIYEFFLNLKNNFLDD
tara:strand:- start:558 stop:710 length:153 start_codon:yes stop_codon:yes gene_type:complete